MRVHVKLHGVLREKLPPEQKGQTELELEEGATGEALFNALFALGLKGRFEVAVNEEIIEEDDDLLIVDGDRVDVFRPAAGG